MTKEELRGQMRAMRAELTGDKREAAEQQAVDHMMAFLRQKRPRRFYPFVSCRTEIDTLQLLQRVWKELPEIAVAVPRVEGNRMQFYEAVTIKANEETPEIFVDNPFAFKPATEKYSKYNTALSNSLNDFIMQIISGTKSYDDLETFQSDFEAKGGEEVRTELQDWYQSFYSNK